MWRTLHTLLPLRSPLFPATESKYRWALVVCVVGVKGYIFEGGVSLRLSLERCPPSCPYPSHEFFPLLLQAVYNGHTDDALLLFTLLPRKPCPCLSQRR